MRSSQPEVRNPILQLEAARRFAELMAAQSPEFQQAFADLLTEASRDCAGRANSCWRKHKAPMAAYWKAFGVYARHLRLALRTVGPRRYRPRLVA